MKKPLLILIILLVALIAGLIWKMNTPPLPLPPPLVIPEVVVPPSHYDLIRVSYPLPNDEVKSPLTVVGEARGSWFFEGSFPVYLTDWDGKIIAEGHATAKADWMTTEFVPFEATLTFTTERNVANNSGTLILKKDNPSGLPKNDDALEIHVILKNPPASNDKSVGNGSGGNSILPYQSGIKGTVTLGPTCPVMRNPPDPQCADKPYKTTVSVSRTSDTSHVFATTESGTDGTFQFSLPPGDYTVKASGGAVLPRCGDVATNVSASAYTDIAISCDTGIR